MDERSDMEKGDEIMLPGFRFHPTDEELVGFYLKRKIQQKPLPIELIRQLDIYKYDPWDLPKLATTAEREWYFYCPRDRKYKNSARPNRVTGAGFWKATGTDRPIYSEGGTRCIGLKKSLVFYTGRAAKGIKTDWMMHEFRLPSSSSLTDSSLPKRPSDKTISINDSWAICKIFKKTNSMAQRALSHSWMTTETNREDLFSISKAAQGTQLSSEMVSCPAEAASAIQFAFSNSLKPQQQDNTIGYALESASYSPSLLPISSVEVAPTSFIFFPEELQLPPSKNTMDVPPMLLNLSPSMLGDAGKTLTSIDFEQPQQFDGISVHLPMKSNASFGNGEEDISHSNNQLGVGKSLSFPFSLLPNTSDEWKPNLPWESPPYPCEISQNYSANKCFT